MYNTEFQVLVHEVDTNNFIRPTCLMAYLQETAERHMDSAKPSYMDLFNSGKAFLLARMNIEVYKPIRMHDKIFASTWPSDGKGVTFYRSHRMVVNGEVVAEASGVWALVDIATSRFYRVGEVDLSNYITEPPLQSTFHKRVRIPDNIALKKVGEHNVCFTQVDCNRHMNNANYADMCVNYVQDVDKLTLKGMSFNFLAEAPLGCTIEIFRSALITNEDGTLTYYFRTVRDGATNIEAEFRFTHN